MYQRHERHDRHGSEKAAYLCGFLNDDHVTVPEHARNRSSRKTTIGMGKSAANNAHYGDDDELQRFSKWVEELVCITTPADYHGAHESFYLPPWQRRASRWNFSVRA